MTVLETCLGIYDEIRACTRCKEPGEADPLGEAVVPAGSITPRLAVVGQSPGQTEVEVGEPFCGASGALLDRLLGIVGLDRFRDVFITNAVACHPPGNRNPHAWEIVGCQPYLKRQLKAIRPPVVLLLGKIAWLPFESAIEFGHGKIRTNSTPKLLVSYHPSFFLRNQKEEVFLQLAKPLAALLSKD